MKIHFDFDTKHYDNAQVILVGAFSKKDGGVQLSWSDAELKKEFSLVKASENFKAASKKFSVLVIGGNLACGHNFLFQRRSDLWD